MNDILAVFRVEHPDLALTETVAHDKTATIRPIRQAGTDPERDRYLFSVTSDDFDRFEAGLAADATVERFERVVHLEDEAVYAITYADHSVLFSTVIGRLNGVILEFKNAGTAWVLKTWFPDREGAQRLWEYANEHDMDIELERVNEYASVVSNSYGLTPTQREAIIVALEAGYFDEPRKATLEDVADELDISQPSAGGLLRRGLKRLAESTVAEASR